MFEFMRAGGFGIWVVLLFGGITLVSGAMFVAKPVESRIGFLRGMSTATAFAIGSGVAANFAMVMWRVPQVEEWASSPKLPLIVMTGIAESLTPAILGFTMLALAWLMIAVGHRRLAANGE